MARQCTQPKRPRNSTWFKEKMLLVQAQESGQVLDEEQLVFLIDLGVAESQVTQTTIPQNSAFQIDDLDAYDSDCDDISSSKAVLMANLSSYGSDVLSEYIVMRSEESDSEWELKESESTKLRDMEYDRFQNSYLQLDALVAGVSDEEANHSFGGPFSYDIQKTSSSSLTSDNVGPFLSQSTQKPFPASISQSHRSGSYSSKGINNCSLWGCKLKIQRNGSRQEAGRGQDFKPMRTEKEALLTIDEGQIPIGETDAGYYDIPLYSRFKQEDIDDSLSLSMVNMDLNLYLLVLCVDDRSLFIINMSHLMTVMGSRSCSDLQSVMTLSHGLSPYTSMSRVRVTKPQNKTPYELLFGHKPILSYIRPFGCHVTILNTLSPLGKFDGKSDEGFLVGYSVNSKAGSIISNPKELNSMNYIPVSLQNQANPAGSKEVIDIDVQTEEAADLMVVSSTSLTGATRKAVVSEKIAKKKTHSPKPGHLSTPKIQVLLMVIMTFRKELDALALKHLGPVPATAPTSTNPVNTGSDNLNTGFEEVTPGNIEAISPSADHEEEVFSDADDDEMPEINEVDVSTNPHSEDSMLILKGQILGLIPFTPVQTEALSRRSLLEDESWVKAYAGRTVAVKLIFHGSWWIYPLGASVKSEELLYGKQRPLWLKMKEFVLVRGFQVTQRCPSLCSQEDFHESTTGGCQFLRRRFYLELERMLQAQLGHEKGHASCHLLIGCRLVHKQVVYLFKSAESAGYTEIVDFLRRSKLRRQLQISRMLQGLTCANEEIFADYKNIGPLLPAMLTIDAGQAQPSCAPTTISACCTNPTQSHVQITTPPITSTPPSTTPSPQPSNVQLTTSPPFIQPIQPTPLITLSSPLITTIPDTQPTHPPSPQIPSPPYNETEGPSFDPSSHMLESRVESLEKELSDTKQTLGTAVLKLIKKILRTLLLKDSLLHSTQVNTGSTTSAQVNTGSTPSAQVNTSSTPSAELNTGETKRVQRREGKAPMTEEDLQAEVQASKKSKELQELTDLEAAQRLQATMDAEAQRQIHLDALLARRLVEQEEEAEKEALATEFDYIQARLNGIFRFLAEKIQQKKKGAICY
ncbi:retrovirus-related pol polyprotein from transposon TNT 1-94 [Tanacetum coccineum]|uniref:Retrovirus-related pol polyprotein from transposon TNT 1-94 n=1 Tax=Tanacetum coccineum TaxID=301880 RepID=A0ABQ4Y9L1_9ASTR